MGQVKPSPLCVHRPVQGREIFSLSLYFPSQPHRSIQGAPGPLPSSAGTFLEPFPSSPSQPWLIHLLRSPAVLPRACPSAPVGLSSLQTAWGGQGSCQHRAPPGRPPLCQCSSPLGWGLQGQAVVALSPGAPGSPLGSLLWLGVRGSAAPSRAAHADSNHLGSGGSVSSPSPSSYSAKSLFSWR